MTTKRWDAVAQAATKREHGARIASLEAALKAERAAHELTLRQLERARMVRGARRRPVATATARRRDKGDITEVIFSDVHGHQHCPAAMSAMLADLQVIRPDRIFIGGDFINCGGFLAEHHTLGYVAQQDESYEEDVATSNRLLDAIQNASSCPDIHYLEGNHEWRVERWAVTQRLSSHKDIEYLRRTFAPENLLRLKERGIRYYRQGFIHAPCKVQGWVKLDKLFYVHKISNAADAASVAIAKTAGSIVFFDTHRAAFKPIHLPGTGLISAWNPGCLCKLQQMYNNTNPTGWTHGYLMRFISRKTGAYQMVNITINNGISYGGLILGRKTEDAK